MYTDTHVHFDLFRQTDYCASIVNRALAAGVDCMLAVGGDPAANRYALALAEQHSGTIHAVVGYDRDQATANPSMESLEPLLNHDGAVGIGEAGLDYHYSPETAEAQKRLFRSLLAMARRNRKPVVIHSREAEGDTVELLAEHTAEWTGEKDRIGVLHCFTGGIELAGRLLELGLFISFSGIITFKSADDLRKAARMTPDDRLLLETDSPYLAPVPYRGKVNEPAWVTWVGKALAEIRGQTEQHIAEITARNARRLFGLERKEG